MAVRTEEILEKWLIVNELTLSDGSKDDARLVLFIQKPLVV